MLAMNDSTEQVKSGRDLDPVTEAYKKQSDVTLISENLRLTVTNVPAVNETPAIRRRSAPRRKKGPLTKVTDFNALLLPHKSITVVL
jgi:hypothetical protein